MSQFVPSFQKSEQRAHFEAKSSKYYERLDVILPEDNDAVERQQQGLIRQAAARFTHMETLCHAYDNWILDHVLETTELRNFTGLVS